MKAVRPRDILAKRTGTGATLVSRPSAQAREPGPRGATMRCRQRAYGASHSLRWVPDLVPLAQVRSLHSSGTRESHACGCCGVRAANAVRSLPRLRGRVGVGAGVHRSLRSRSARRQSCCVPPPCPSNRSRMFPTSAINAWPTSGRPEVGCKRGRGRWSRINSRWCSSSAAGAPPCARPAPARSGSGCERRWCP